MVIFKDRKGTVYDWLDMLILIIFAFFIMLFLFYASSGVKSVTDNVITDKADIVTARQDLLNFLRTGVAECVSGIGAFPEETRGMTYAQFFIWQDYQFHDGQKLSSGEQETLCKGIDSIFSKEYKDWSLELVRGGEEPFYSCGDGSISANPLNNPEVYTEDLPTYKGNSLTAFLKIER